MFGFKFCENGPTGLADLLENVRHVGLLRLQVGRFLKSRCFVEGAQVLVVTPHALERTRGGVGIREGGNIRVIKNLLSAKHFGTSHPAGEKRLAIEPAERF